MNAALLMTLACSLGEPVPALPELLFAPNERAARHAITLDRPAQNFFEGALLGNGGLGAVVRTRPDSVLIHLGHNDVWDIRVAEENREKLVTFKDLWARLKRNSPEDQAWYKRYCVMARENYAQSYPRPWPCGTLLLGFDRRVAEITGHRVEIDAGLCEVQFLVNGRPARLCIFVEPMVDRVWLAMVDEHDAPAVSPFNRVRLMPEKGMETLEQSGDSWLSFRQVLPVLGPAREKDKALRVSFHSRVPIRPASDKNDVFVAHLGLTYGLASALSSEAPNPVRPEVAGCDEAGISTYIAWRDYWQASGVHLDDEVLERTWYRNLYFLNCSVRPGVTCPGLFANWSFGSIGTAWHGDYHTNYNLQQPFWVTFSSNHVDKHLPYVDLVDFLLPVSRAWAREHYELPGAFFPHSAYPVEMTMMPYPVPTWGAEVCETPWVVQSLWWHYLYTMDRQFLRDRAIGPIREAVTFLNAYMRRPEARGPQWGDDRFHIYPTVVPELRGLQTDPKLSADCIVDLALTKFVFKAYLQAVELLELKEEGSLPGEVREILEHCPLYPTADSPAGKVFVSVWGERSQQVYNTPNPLCPVFPGEDIGPDSPAELREIATNTWRNQLNEGGNDLVFQNLQGARLGLLDLERFKRQIRYCELPNGTCTDMVLQAGGRYADDTAYDFMARMGVWFENFALPAVINECLLQGYDGRIRLFPNWPADKDAAFYRLRTAGAFLVSAEQAEGRLRWVQIRATAPGELRLINPWLGQVQLVENRWPARLLSGRELRLKADRGDVWEFRPAD